MTFIGKTIKYVIVYPTAAVVAICAVALIDAGFDRLLHVEESDSSVQVSDLKFLSGDMVLIVDFTIKNHNSSPVKDIKVVCDGYAQSGTKIDKNKRTIYVKIPAKANYKVNNHNMGFISSDVSAIKCRVKDFSTVA